MMHVPRADHNGQTAATTVLDLDFGAATLPLLRQAVRQCSSAAGLPDTRVMDVVMAVHELAANAVRYGGGYGRLLIQVTPGTLHCRVSDPGTARPLPWPVRQAHGLWIVQSVATRVHAATGPAGSVVAIQFLLPAARTPGG